MDDEIQFIDESIKIGFFGDHGKTAVCLRYLKGEFSEGYIPTIEDEFSKIITINDRSINLAIIDTAGQDDFAEMRYSYFKLVNGSIIFVDISNPSSIDDLRMIYDDMKDSSDDDPIIVIGALNADLRDDPTISQETLISKGEIQNLSSEFDCEVFECSAKTNLNIDNLIHTLVKKILDEQIQKNEEVNFKSEWNIGIVSVKDDDKANKLASRYIYGDLYEEMIFHHDFEKYVEVDNMIIPLTLYTYNYDFRENLKYYPKVQGIVFVFSLNNHKAYDELIKICKLIKQNVGENLISIIAANNCELRNRYNFNSLISYELLEHLEKELNIKVIEVSYETNENVEELFLYILKKIVQNKKKQMPKHLRHKKEKEENEKHKKKFSFK